MTQQCELQFENLKNEAEAFNTEWKKKIEDELRAREEGVALIWRGRSVSLTSKKLDLTQPLSLLQQARLENNDIHTAVEGLTQHSGRINSISSNACGSSLSSNFNAIGGLGEQTSGTKHQRSGFGLIRDA